MQEAACNAKVASGAKLEHGDKKVDLFTLGLAEERALFGSDERGVFVVSVSEANDEKGNRLFVSTDETASVVEVEYDEDKQTCQAQRRGARLNVLRRRRERAFLQFYEPSSHRSASRFPGFFPGAAGETKCARFARKGTIDVTIESDEPDLRGLSGTYYYSFSVGFGWDPSIRSWAWTLDSVAAPGGNGYRGKTRAELSYGNVEGKWDLSLNTGDPYPDSPGLLRATTGPLDKWNSVWGAKWTRVEPIGTMSERQRLLAMPIIKVSARGSGVIAPWT